MGEQADYLVERFMNDYWSHGDVFFNRTRNKKRLAKSKVIYISGKGKWMHRLFGADEFRGNRTWNMSLYPDFKGWDTFKQYGLQQKKKEDEDGKFITVKRSVLKPWSVKSGESPEFDPPTISDSDGDDWGDRGVIGNGSAVTTKLEVYETKNGPGVRLLGVRVDDWVKYEPVEETTSEVTNSTPSVQSGAGSKNLSGVKNTSAMPF